MRIVFTYFTRAFPKVMVLLEVWSFCGKRTFNFGLLSEKNKQKKNNTTGTRLTSEPLENSQPDTARDGACLQSPWISSILEVFQTILKLLFKKAMHFPCSKLQYLEQPMAQLQLTHSFPEKCTEQNYFNDRK